MTAEATTNKNIKLTRQEKRVLNDLGYYACFGLNYPIEKIRKILKLWILVFIASLPLLFVHILIPFLYFFSMVLVLYIGDKKNILITPTVGRPLNTRSRGRYRQTVKIKHTRKIKRFSNRKEMANEPQIEL